MLPAASVEHLHRFLEARGWVPREAGGAFFKFTPPAELALPTGYELTLPRNTDAPDAPDFVARLIGTVASIYELTPQQVEPVLATTDTVFSLQIEDASTRTGSIEFARFETMLKKLRKMLLDSAAFVLVEDPILGRLPAQASLYLSQCRFLQTARGSFVANVQLPSQTVIREATLANNEPLRASAVSDRIVSVLDVVVSSVLTKRQEIFSEEFVTNHLDVLNVNVLQDIDAIFDEAANASLRLSFVGMETTRELNSGLLTADRRQSLAKYVEFVREQVAGILEIDMTGQIVELRSRNPQSNRNYVVVAGIVEHRPAFVALTLSNDLYALANQAHINSLKVHVKGAGRKMKTQIKVTKLDVFEQV